MRRRVPLLHIAHRTETLSDCSMRQTIGQTSKEEAPKLCCASEKWNEQIWQLRVDRISRRFVVRSQDGFWSPMPKEYKTRTSKEFSLSGTATDDESPLGPEHTEGPSPQDDVQTPLFSVRMDAHPVPQVTITPEGSGSPREMQQKDLEDVVEGPLCRKLSSSSISSTGSSAVESEDDLLSDSESRSKGLVTLENLVDAGEVSAGWSVEGVVAPLQCFNNNNNIIIIIPW